MGTKLQPHANRLNALLRQKIDERGLTDADVERHMNAGERYLAKSRNRGTINFDRAVEAIEALGIHPADFFAELFDKAPEGGGGQVSERPKRKRRIRGDGNPAGGGELAGWLEEIDRLRYQDVKIALSSLWSRANDVDPLEAAPYLAVLASCYRSAGFLEDASRCLLMAWEQERVSEVTEADIIQRFAYVLKDGGDLDQALEMSERAGGIFAREDQWIRFGETLVDRTNFLIHLDELSSAEHSLECARKYIREPKTGLALRMRHNLFAMEQQAFLLARKSGDLEKARLHANEGIRLAPVETAKGFVWGQVARLLQDTRQYDHAIAAYQTALRLVEGDCESSLLLTVDLVDLLAKLRRSRQALATAETIAKHMFGLDQRPVAKAALMRLWTQARSLRLQSDTVRVARKALVAGDTKTRPARKMRLLLGLHPESDSKIAAESGVSPETVRRIRSGLGASKRVYALLSAWSLRVRPELRFSKS